MAEIFHPSTNTFAMLSIFGAIFPLAALAWLLAAINRSPYVTRTGVESLAMLASDMEAGKVDMLVILRRTGSNHGAMRAPMGVGFNAYVVRTAGAPCGGHGLELRQNGTQAALSTTQTHHSMEGRHLIRVGTLEHYQPSLRA